MLKGLISVFYSKLFTVIWSRGYPTNSRYFFRSIYSNSNISQSLLSPYTISLNLTIFSCLNSYSNEISLMAVLGIPSSACSSLIFFKATIYKHKNINFSALNIKILPHLFPCPSIYKQHHKYPPPISRAYHTSSQSTPFKRSLGFVGLNIQCPLKHFSRLNVPLNSFS